MNVLVFYKYILTLVLDIQSLYMYIYIYIYLPLNCFVNVLLFYINLKHIIIYIGAKEFNEINWLPTKERVEQRILTNIFKYWKGTSPFYVNELFVLSRNVKI